MRQPTASLHHVAFSTAKLLVLAGTTALHGEGIHAIASFNFASYICMFMCFYRRCVVIHVSWRKPPAATEETTGAGIQECLIMVLRIAGDMVNSLQHTAFFSAKLLQLAGTTVLPKEGIHFLLAAELHNTNACICASTYALF